jgi:hypothetical protein
MTTPKAGRPPAPLRKPKIVPAKILWRLPQPPQPGRVVDGFRPPEHPDARPAPDYFSVRHKVEHAMGSLPLWIEDPPIEDLSEKYADLLYRQIGAAMPMTVQQARAHLAEISKAAKALAREIERAGPDIETQLDACRTTSFDRPGIKRRPRSVADAKLAVQWIAETATLTSPASGKTKGPLRKDFAQEVSQLAVEDYYRLTSLTPTATKRVNGGGFLDFLRTIFEAVEIRHASAERFAADAVKWFKRAFEAHKTDSPDKRFAVAWSRRREIVEE